MNAARTGLAQVWECLRAIPDPELPALSIVDLGIVRDVAWIDETEALRVTVTPTYSGCPATRTIEAAIAEDLHAAGIERVEIVRRLAPPWATDWLSVEAREKLRAYGIAPPEQTAPAERPNLARFLEPRVEPRIGCPRCASPVVEPLSRFGSTPCKALYRCLTCREPFDHFKCH